jgi:hypothetical protein
MSKYILRNELKQFKNKYQGERIFIIGNGPSLDKTPLSRLNSEYSFAMNKINGTYSETDWRPSFYYVSQPTSHPEAPHKNGCDYIKENVELGIPCFLRSDYTQYTEKNVYHLNVSSLHSRPLFDNIPNEEISNIELDLLCEFWSDDISRLVYHYHTIYGVLQLAKYMGFNQIYLIGCDLGFEYFDPHMIFQNGMDPHRYQSDTYSYLKEAKGDGTFLQSFANGVVLKIIKNSLVNRFLNNFLSNADSYFSSDYTKRFRIHDGPRVDAEISKSHLVAKRICANDNIKIYNATLGGELDVYDRVNLNEVLDSISR